jgi:5-methylcytosine-specific restriction endonuclease McrA
VEARWRLVETAWELNISHKLITVAHDQDSGNLFPAPASKGRPAVTSCRKALNGYQKGKCFYCFDDISIVTGSKDLADVDHFFPRILEMEEAAVGLDGVWNLVLACAQCNCKGRSNCVALGGAIV